MPGPAFVEGDDVDLCTIEEEDLPALHEAINDPSMWRTTGMSRPNSMAAEREWFESLAEADDAVSFAVAASGDLVGNVGLRDIDGNDGTAEIGFYVLPAHQGEGYATQAARLAVGYAFDHQRLHRVDAETYGFNEASRRVLEKAGFEHEGVRRDAAFVDGAYRDVHVYGALASEWRE
jgi:RimJ/RimL family protein N-acetyltransferase